MATIAELTTGATASTGEVWTHPVYAAFRSLWITLAHAYEGTGGFADGTYLIAHPREWLDHTADRPEKPSKKLLERRRLARYENWPSTIITLLQGALFRTPPSRRAGSEDTPHPISQWWDDVDGLGSDCTTWLRRAWVPAAVFGHQVVLMDRPRVAGATAADAPPLFLRTYTPLDVPDWLTDDMGRLVAVALKEHAPRTRFDQQTGTDYVREVSTTGWRVRGAAAAAATMESQGDHDFAGALPVIVLYARRRALVPLVGYSLLGDPQLYVDGYNLTSEMRELLRKQTFSIINVPLGVGDQQVSPQAAQAMIGESTGSANVLFTPEAASVLTPDNSNITVYRSELVELTRAIFRASGLPWDADSRDAESAESRRIKREDLNQVLSLYAAELQEAERAIAELWFRGTYGASWQQEWDRAEVSISYPDTFDAEVLDDLIARAQAAIGLDLGPLASTLLRGQIAAKMLPDISPEQQQQIQQEIAAVAVYEAEEADLRKQRLALPPPRPLVAPVNTPPDDTADDGAADA